MFQVAVIDGADLLLTPFRTMVVPPPMCAVTLKLPGPIDQIAFGPPSAPQQVRLKIEPSAVLKIEQSG